MFKFLRRKQDQRKDSDDTGAMALVMQRAQIGQMYADRLCDGGENQPVERRYYENVRDELLGLLMQMSDRHCREMASQSVIKMCMAAGDEPVARALFAGIEDRFLRQKITASAPSLSAADRANPARENSADLVFTSPDTKDGSVDVLPGGQDHGFTIRPEGDRFALYNRQGKWFECDSVEEGRRLLENLLKGGRS